MINETWEQTKKRLAKKGIGRFFSIGDKPKTGDGEKQKEIPKTPLYEIRKITLPLDPKHPQGKLILYAVPCAEADWWLENKLKVALYQDDSTNSKTMVFYEKFLIDGTPKEKNIYSNPERFCTEDFPGFRGTRGTL